MRLVREKSDEAMEDYKFLPLANLRNGGPVDWINVVVDNNPMGVGSQP